MKPQLLDRSSTQPLPFVVRENRFPNFLKLWHYHPELELVIIKESKGTRFVGDSIEKFQPGEVILIGKNLPHMWLNDDIYFQEDSGLEAVAYIIHFREDFVGQSFLELPYTKVVTHLLKNARKGIRFINLETDIVNRIEHLIEETSVFTGLIKFLEILYDLGRHKDIKILASDGYRNNTLTKSTDKTHEFIFANFNKPISLTEVARIEGMNPSAFSRYFKRIHRKTFSRYLIEIRIGYACKLLLEYKANISTACFEAGFNSISNFNKQFRKIKGMNPSEYIKSHRQIV